MCNSDVRCEILASGLKLWQIAEALGITDATFSRKLRKELPDETKTQIREIIAELVEKGAEHDR